MNPPRLQALLVLSCLLSISPKPAFEFKNPQEAMQFLGERMFEVNKSMVEGLRTLSKSLDKLPEDYEMLAAQRDIHLQLLKEIDYQIQLKDEALALSDRTIQLLLASEKMQMQIMDLQRKTYGVQRRSLELSRAGLKKTKELTKLGQESHRLSVEASKVSEEIVAAVKKVFGLPL